MKAIHGQFPHHNSREIKKKNDTKESHLYLLCFKMSSYEMLLLIFMGVEIILFENSVLKMYQLNTQLNFHINSLNYFILFIYFLEQFVGSI